jgi:hypothetical protein
VWKKELFDKPVSDTEYLVNNFVGQCPVLLIIRDFIFGLHDDIYQRITM